jgi:hypothetical protein
MPAEMKISDAESGGRGEAATTEGDRIGVSACGRTGENDVLKPLSPERNPRENTRSSMSAL